MSDNIRPIKSVRRRHTRAVYGRVLRGAGRLLTLMLVFAALGGLGLALFRLSDEARSLFHLVARYSAFAYAAHLAVTVCLWLGWEKLVALLVSRGLVPEHARPALLERRGRWCAALLTLQLILLASSVGQPA